MVRLLAFLSIIFYFFAVFFGMMFYFDNFGKQNDAVMSAGELYGYSTLQLETPQMAKEIQAFLEKEREIQAKIENLKTELQEKVQAKELAIADTEKAKAELQKIQKDLEKYKKGEELADLLLRLPPIDAAQTIATYSDLELRFFVKYVIPLMKEDAIKEKLYKKLLQAIGPNKILATKISKFTIQKEERANN